MAAEESDSLGGEATFAGKAAARPQRADVSLGDERTIGGGAAAAIDTVFDEIEVVNLAARYKTEGTLGRGGMGEVLLALDTRLDRKVAIKRILGETARSQTAVSRFLTEAKAIAALNHPNIVQIYDYGRAKDGPFLIMEYVDGGTLLDRCRESALPLDEAIDLACQLCEGLAKAHDLSIVHRDIKPANVLLTKDGIPKLTDFGLAKAEANDHGQTMTGAVLGTPDFMPPEQRRDASLVDHRSDLWSLAATVYQMVTGRSPKIIRFDLLPAGLTIVLGKALEDSKDDRYQSARELRDALRLGLRPTAAVENLIEGTCPSCGVKNESSRRFCRGCGGSLEALCLSCDKPMPMWEEICGSCGSTQTPLVRERRHAMAAKQAEAEGLLDDFGFDRALGIATQLRDEAHPQLKHLCDWGASFVEQIEKSRDEQTRHAVSAMTEAGKHVAEYDYLSAMFVLETVPEALRAGVLPGMRESVGAMLDRIKKMQGEARRLEARIKERLAAKNLDELLPDVERLLTLRPDRDDLKAIRVQLVERQQKKAAAGAKAIEVAKASLTSHDYEGALAALSRVPPEMIAPEVFALRARTEGLIRKVRGLASQIKEAVVSKQFEGLLGTVEQYRELKPTNAEIEKLWKALKAREEKIAAEITACVGQVRKLCKSCRFADAVAAIEQIPKSRRSAAVEELDRACRALAEARLAAQSAYDTGSRSGSYDAFMSEATRYESLLRSHALRDEELTDRLLACDKKMRHRQASREATAAALRVMSFIKKTGILVAVTAMTVVGVYFFVREKYDDQTDAFVFKWLPILLMLGAWAFVVRRGLENWHEA